VAGIWHCGAISILGQEQIEKLNAFEGKRRRVKDISDMLGFSNPKDRVYRIIYDEK